MISTGGSAPRPPGVLRFRGIDRGRQRGEAEPVTALPLRHPTHLGARVALQQSPILRAGI